MRIRTEEWSLRNFRYRPRRFIPLIAVAYVVIEPMMYISIGNSGFFDLPHGRILVLAAVLAPLPFLILVCRRIWWLGLPYLDQAILLDPMTAERADTVIRGVLARWDPDGAKVETERDADGDLPYLMTYSASIDGHPVAIDMRSSREGAETFIGPEVTEGWFERFVRELDGELARAAREDDGLGGRGKGGH